MSGNIEVREVNAEVYLAGRSGKDFRPTSINVERSINSTANMGTIKGIMPGDEEPDSYDQVEIFINDRCIFTGNPSRATLNDEGVYTIEAYDHGQDLSRIKENISTDRRQQYHMGLLTELLDKYGIEYDVERPFSKYSGDNGPSQHKFKDKSLNEILNNLTNRMGAYWWVSPENVVKIRPEPNVERHFMDEIVSISAGDGESSGNQVVIFGGSPASEDGQSQARMYAHNQLKSSASITYGDADSDNEKEYKVKDQTLTSQVEVDAFLNSKVGQFARDIKAGRMTIVGNENVDPYHTLIVPRVPNMGDLAAGDYMAKTVTHKFTSQQGYTTEIELGLSHPEVQSVVDGVDEDT